MNEKVADNRIIENKKINDIENKIDNEKNKLKKLDDVRNDFVSYNKTINNCLDLLSSVKNEESRRKYDDMYLKNNTILKKMTTIIDEKKTTIQKNINNLYDQKIKSEKKQETEEIKKNNKE